MAYRKLLALDVGTSSARAFLGSFDGERLSLRECGRSEHTPVTTPTGCYWEMQGIYSKLEELILRADSEFEGLDSISLDSWGTDMVAVDRAGDLLTAGISTRDPRFCGLKERFFQEVSRHEIYARTGIQFLNWNSLYLVYELAQNKPWLLDAIDQMMFAPDYFLYLISGARNCDYTIASTSQMLNPWTRQWDQRLVQKTGIGLHRLGTPCRMRELGAVRCLRGRTRVYSGANHDTAAAVAGIPAVERDFLYIIAGSWAMMGTQTDEPIINEDSERYGFSNEGGIDGQIRFLKNSMGMWLIQESRRAWARKGLRMEYAQIASEGKKAARFAAVIDVNDPRLQPSGDIPEILSTLCQENLQPVPRTVGETVRLINDSLALKFALLKEQIEACTGKAYHEIYVVAGGSQDSALCQAIADATDCRVRTGPVESSAYGNLCTQLIAAGMVKNLSDARAIVRRSIRMEEFLPQNHALAMQRLEENRQKLCGTVS